MERLAALAATKPVADAAREIEFVFAVGPSYFLEIAKLRAARLLWAQAVSAFGSKDDNACSMRLHVRTARRNKSLYDRYTNLLRATTEALSAVIGGCDRLTVEPFGFDAHLAVNIQRILMEEAHMDAVADPAGGSYYIEALTDSMAREAWKLFQQVEAEGGYAKALESGSIGKSLAETRAARDQARVKPPARPWWASIITPISPRRRLGPNAPAGAEQPAAAMPGRGAVRKNPACARLSTRAPPGRYPKVLLLKRGDVKMKGARVKLLPQFLRLRGL